MGRFRYLYTLLFVVFLVIVQAYALGLQFARGFMLFRNPPTRVAFSWDMFATRVERCDMVWDPPLSTMLGDLGSLKRFGTKLEWDVIYDHASDYRELGRMMCQFDQNRSVPKTIRLNCFLPDGTNPKEEFPCG